MSSSSRSTGRDTPVTSVSANETFSLDDLGEPTFVGESLRERNGIVVTVVVVVDKVFGETSSFIYGKGSGCRSDVDGKAEGKAEVGVSTAADGMGTTTTISK
jgi:hypothetical protein